MVADPQVTYCEVARPVTVSSAQRSQIGALFAASVSQGAALGWVGPPTSPEVTALLDDIADAAATGNASMIVAATQQNDIIGCGYWRRYQRPTHWPHADLERVVVARDHQRQGIGRALVSQLVASANRAGIEQLTLDARADSAAALALYREMGFVEYGRLSDFVAVGERRYDKTLWVLDLRTSDHEGRSREG